MSNLPTEIWAMVLSYSDDTEHLWRACRHVSSALKAGVEIYITTILIPNLVTVTLEYSCENKQTISCHRGAFKKYSKDGQFVYFDMTSAEYPGLRYRHTDRMCFNVIKYPLEEEEKSWEVWAESKGPSHDRFYSVRLLDGVTASPTDSNKGMLTFGLDLEDLTMSFDWREMMTKSFMDSTGSDEYFFDKLVWRGGRDYRFPWWCC